MAPKDKSATPSRNTPAPSGVPGAVYEDGAATSTVLGKDSPPWSPKTVGAHALLPLHAGNNAARDVVRAVNGSFHAAADMLEWHKKNPGLLSPDLELALLFITHNLSPFDVSCAEVKAEVCFARAAAAAVGHSREAVEKHEARLDSMSTLADKLVGRTNLLEGKADQLETGLAEQGTRHDARIQQQDRCLHAHAQQLDVQHLALANQLAHKQLEKLATKEDLQQLIQQQQSSKRRSSTASSPSSKAEEEEAPAEKEPPSYAELQAELQALKANQASTSKATSDKAKFKGKKAKTGAKGHGRASENSVEAAERQAEYHRRRAAESTALAAERA